MSEKKRNHSKKRDEILRALRSTKLHPSAEQLHSMLKESIPDLSLATVYRNIALFREDGQVVSVGFVHGQERFDARTEPHTHFICEGCGSVSDVVTDATADSTAELEERYGCAVSSCRIEYRGICRSCRKRQTVWQ